MEKKIKKGIKGGRDGEERTEEERDKEYFSNNLCTDYVLK